MSAVEQISLFNTLFYVFMGIAALGLALSVFFFFYFDIPSVYAMMTGKAKRDTIRKMEEENFKTGKLRNQYPKHTGDTKHSGRIGHSGRIASKKAAVSPPQESIPAAEPPQAYETGVLNMDTPGTAVLSSTAAETAVLHSGYGETVPLNHAEMDYHPPVQMPVAPMQNEPQIRFQITENTMVIHTNEFI